MPTVALSACQLCLPCSASEEYKDFLNSTVTYRLNPALFHSQNKKILIQEKDWCSCKVIAFLAVSKVVVLLVLPQTHQVILDKEIREALAFLKLGSSNFPPVTLSNLFNILNICLSPHNILSKGMLQSQSHNTKREIRGWQWPVRMRYGAVFNYIVMSTRRTPASFSAQGGLCSQNEQPCSISFSSHHLINVPMPNFLHTIQTLHWIHNYSFPNGFSLVLFFHSILLINRN